MAFELDAKQDVREQIRKVACSRLDQAIAALHQRGNAPRASDPAIHTARKRLKEVRALLRLVRDDLGEKRFARDNKALRNAARPLSEVRDATALLDAVGLLQKHYGGEVKGRAFEALRRALRARRRRMRRRILDGDRAAGHAAATARKVRRRIDRWKLEHGAWKAVQLGLRTAYETGREARTVARKDPSDERLHEWRKRSKDLRYQLELLAPLSPAVMETAAQQAKALSDMLGDDHDLAVLRGLLDGELEPAVPRKMAEALRALMDRRRADLQTSALALSDKLYAESPGAFVGRVKAYWKAAANGDQSANRRQRAAA